MVRKRKGTRVNAFTLGNSVYHLSAWNVLGGGHLLLERAWPQVICLSLWESYTPCFFFLTLFLDLTDWSPHPMTSNVVLKCISLGRGHLDRRLSSPSMNWTSTHCCVCRDVSGASMCPHNTEDWAAVVSWGQQCVCRAACARTHTNTLCWSLQTNVCLAQIVQLEVYPTLC